MISNWKKRHGSILLWLPTYTLYTCTGNISYCILALELMISQRVGVSHCISRSRGEGGVGMMDKLQIVPIGHNYYLLDGSVKCWGPVEAFDPCRGMREYELM